MLTVFSPVLDNDADELESHWGIAVALEMLREQVIGARDFFELCEEAASATGRAARTPALRLR